MRATHKDYTDSESFLLELRLLGPFEARVRGAPLTSFPSRKARWLLALLALRLGRDIPRDRLATMLWPDSEPQKALFNLRHTLSALRNALGQAASCLRASEQRALSLDSATVWADVNVFDRLVASQEQASLEQAVSLYRGPLLADCQEEWADAERELRQQGYLRALEMLAALSAAQKDHPAAIRALRLLVSADPYRESAHCALMQALTESGDHAAVIQVYRDLRLRLHHDLNAEVAPETEALYRTLRTRPHPSVSPPSLSAPGGPPRRLPVPLSDLIGREQEVVDVVGWLGKYRLVTLTGPGGVGKTRLAIAAAEAILARFPEGVWFVDLAPLSDPSSLPHAVAKALGVREERGRPLVETIEAALASRRLLLLLDNCEHLLDASAALGHRLLAALPNLCLLATSRQALGLPGEQVYPVPTLAIPPPGQSREEKEVTSLLEYAAVRLFVERATQANPAFRLSRPVAQKVTEICRRLDGIPLALEMAAARIRSLSVQAIRDRLEDRFRLLTSGSRATLPRQQTLQAAIDWSWNLLSEAEQALLGRLSVFAGGWTLEATEGVLGVGRWVLGPNTQRPIPNTDDVLELLTGLVDKSLIVYEEHSGQARYRMLETVGAYARERLRASGEEETAQREHLLYFLGLAEEAEPNLLGPEQSGWFERLELEHDNLGGAFRYSFAWEGTRYENERLTSRAMTDGIAGLTTTAPDPDVAGLRLAGALWRFWDVRGYVGEGRAHLAAALSRVDVMGAAEARVKALYGAALLALRQGDHESTCSFLEERRIFCQKLGDKRGIGWSLYLLGYVSLYQNDMDAASSLFEESLALFKESGDRQGISESLQSLGHVCHNRSGPALARPLYEESLALRRALGDKGGIAGLLLNLATVAYRTDDTVLGSSLIEESLVILREVGDKQTLVHALGGQGHFARERGDYSRASAFYTESMALRRELGDRFLIAQALEDFAGLAWQQGQHERAARLLGAAEMLCQTISISPPAASQGEYDRILHTARAALGEEGFAAIWEDGRALAQEQAIEYALVRSNISPTGQAMERDK